MLRMNKFEAIEDTEDKKEHTSPETKPSNAGPTTDIEPVPISEKPVGSLAHTLESITVIDGKRAIITPIRDRNRNPRRVYLLCSVQLFDMQDLNVTRLQSIIRHHGFLSTTVELVTSDRGSQTFLVRIVH